MIRTYLLKLFLRVGFFVWGVAIAGDYQIDSVRSHISLDGTAAGSKLLEQSAGSLTGQLTGLVRVAVGGGQVTFAPGSRLVFLENRSFGPGLNGSEGSAPASFGAKAAVKTPLGNAAATAASRDLVFGLASGPLPLNGTQFPAGGIVCSFLDGGNSHLDYRLQSFVSVGETLLLAGLATNKVLTSQGSLTTSNTLETLEIPIDATFVFRLLNDGDTVLHFTGQLVATRDTSAVEPPQIVEFTPPTAGRPLTLRWSKDYALQRATKLNPPDWTTIAVDPPREVPASGPGEFYRLISR